MPHTPYLGPRGGMPPEGYEVTEESLDDTPEARMDRIRGLLTSGTRAVITHPRSPQEKAARRLRVPFPTPPAAEVHPSQQRRHSSPQRRISPPRETGNTNPYPAKASVLLTLKLENETLRGVLHRFTLEIEERNRADRITMEREAMKDREFLQAQEQYYRDYLTVERAVDERERSWRDLVRDLEQRCAAAQASATYHANLLETRQREWEAEKQIIQQQQGDQVKWEAERREWVALQTEWEQREQAWQNSEEEWRLKEQAWTEAERDLVERQRQMTAIIDQLRVVKATRAATPLPPPPPVLSPRRSRSPEAEPRPQFQLSRSPAAMKQIVGELKEELLSLRQQWQADKAAQRLEREAWQREREELQSMLRTFPSVEARRWDVHRSTLSSLAREQAALHVRSGSGQSTTGYTTAGSLRSRSPQAASPLSSVPPPPPSDTPSPSPSPTGRATSADQSEAERQARDEEMQRQRQAEIQAVMFADEDHERGKVLMAEQRGREGLRNAMATEADALEKSDDLMDPPLPVPHSSEPKAVPLNPEQMKDAAVPAFPSDSSHPQPGRRRAATPTSPPRETRHEDGTSRPPRRSSAPPLTGDAEMVLQLLKRSLDSGALAPSALQSLATQALEDLKDGEAATTTQHQPPPPPPPREQPTGGETAGGPPTDLVNLLTSQMADLQGMAVVSGDEDDDLGDVI